jgi:hypothetical protein
MLTVPPCGPLEGVTLMIFALDGVTENPKL